MASKRFIKPIRPDVTIPAIYDWESIRINRNALARNEYRYALAEAKRTHPEWTLAQRKDYASRSAESLFD